MTESQLIDQFARGIAHKEGWDKTSKLPTVAQRLNNPLCLTHWKDGDGQPYPEVNGYVEFPTAVIGWRAGRAQCRINILKRKLTWREFFAGKPGVYKGFCSRMDADQTPAQYAREVMAIMRVNADLDTPIFALLGVADGAN